MANLTVMDQDYLEPVGMVDGEHIFLACSSCKAKLVDIWINLPKQGMTWKGRANCPYCGDQSYIQEWQGGFVVGGIHLLDPNDEEKSFDKTSIISMPIVDGIIQFNIRKVGDEQPVL